MRQTMHPYGGVNPLIDKMIGNAYDIVKYVARYLKEIRYVAENMATVYEAVHGNTRLVVVENNGSLSISVDLPDDVLFGSIENISVIASTSSEIYAPGPDTFNFGVSGGQIHISVGSLPALEYATYKCQITFDPDFQYE